MNGTPQPLELPALSDTTPAAPTRHFSLSTLLAFLLLLCILALLIADRCYYLNHFGFLYTDSDQASLWYQADDISKFIFREPCFYGQSYNIPLEAWVAAPLLWFHVPHAMALPIAASFLGIFPFLFLALAAFRKGYHWGASLILAVPLALPVEYLAITSLPRGFVAGVAVAAPAVALWLFSTSRKAFILAAFFAVFAVTVNPNSSIILLAAGVYALLINYRKLAFYGYSLLGALLATPLPITVWLFYKYHPECDAYHVKNADMVFHWQTLRESFFMPMQNTFNHATFDMFFADLVPVGHKGWLILWILPILFVALLLVRRFKFAIAFFIAAGFTLLTLGIDRIHSSSPHIFYPGSRMYLALPVLIAVALLWFVAGLNSIFKKWRFIPPAVAGVLLLSLLVMTCYKKYALLKFPSPLIPRFCLPPVETVYQLKSDAAVVEDMCRKYNVSLVLISNSWFTCFNEAGPSMSNYAFETLAPDFERRTYRIKEERTRLHENVIVFQPQSSDITNAQRIFPHATIISRSPRLLLIECKPPGLSGMEISDKIGIPYRSTF